MPSTIQTTLFTGTTSGAFNTTTNWSTGTKLSGGNVSGTAQAGAAGSITLAAGDAAGADEYKGYIIFLTAGTGAGQWRVITANNAGTKVATVSSNWGTNPDNSSVYTIGDIGIFKNSAVSVSSDFSQTYASRIDLYTSYTATGIGTSAAYLAIKTGQLNIGLPGTGSGNLTGPTRVNIDCGNIGAVGTTVFIGQCASTATDTGQTVVRLLGTALNITQNSGSASMALLPSETGSIINLSCFGGSFQMGANSSISGTLLVSGGSVTNFSVSDTPTVSVDAGVYTTYGTGTHGTLTVYPNATVYYNSTGTIATLDISGTFDLSQGAGTVTVTNKVLLRRGAKLRDPNGRLSMSAGFESTGCDLSGDSNNAQYIGPLNKTYT